MADFYVSVDTTKHFVPTDESRTQLLVLTGWVTTFESAKHPVMGFASHSRDASSEAPPISDLARMLESERHPELVIDYFLSKILKSFIFTDDYWCRLHALRVGPFDVRKACLFHEGQVLVPSQMKAHIPLQSIMEVILQCVGGDPLQKYPGRLR